MNLKSEHNSLAPGKFEWNFRYVIFKRILVVKVQFRGPEHYKKKGALFQEESYLPRIFRSSSLNLHIFHLIHIAFRCQIFFRNSV